MPYDVFGMGNMDGSEQIYQEITNPIRAHGLEANEK